MKKLRTLEEIKTGIEKVKKAMDKFHRDFDGRIPEDTAVSFLVTAIADRAAFLDRLAYKTAEMHINTVPAELASIYKKLEKKYNERAKIEVKEVRKMIKKQMKEMRKAK